MKRYVLAVTVTMLMLSGCGKNPTTDNTQTTTLEETTEDTLRLKVNESDLAGGREKPEKKEEIQPETKKEIEKPKVLTEVKLGFASNPTAVSFAELAKKEDEEESYNVYNFTIEDTEDEIINEFNNNELDIISISPLKALELCKENPNAKIVAVNSLENISVFEKGNDIKQIKNLKDKTIYAYGTESSQKALNYILSKNNAQTADIQWKSTAQEVIDIINNNDNYVCILPEPYASSVKAEQCLNITNQWESLTDAPLISSCIVATTEFIEKKEGEPYTIFVHEYSNSLKNASTNASNTVEYIEEFDMLPISVSTTGIQNCNFLYEDEAKELFKSYSKVLELEEPEDKIFH